MKRKTIRTVIDVLLGIMLILEMFIQFTGEFLHEVIGFAFFATMVIHLALSATWIKGCARNAQTGNLNKRAIVLAVMGSLLGITSVVLAVSSIAISGILASAGFTCPLGSYALWASIHSTAAYALCALVVVHLATHWVSLASSFRIPYDPSRRRAIGTSVNAMAALGAVALGVAALNEALPYAAQAAQATQGTQASQSGQATQTSQTAFTNSATSSSTEAPTTRTRHERGARNSSSSSAESSSSSSSFAPSSSSSSSSSGSTAQPSSGTSSSSNTGICTLCRKQCSLSAPQCNKPYERGLL